MQVMLDHYAELGASDADILIAIDTAARQLRASAKAKLDEADALADYGKRRHTATIRAYKLKERFQAQLPAEARGCIEDVRIDGDWWHVILKYYAADYDDERITEPVRRAIQEIDRGAQVSFGSRP